MSCFYTVYIAICKAIDRIRGRRRRYRGAEYSMVGMPPDGHDEDELERESLLYHEECQQNSSDSSSDTSTDSDDEGKLDHPFKEPVKIIFHHDE